MTKKISYALLLCFFISSLKAQVKTSDIEYQLHTSKATTQLINRVNQQLPLTDSLMHPFEGESTEGGELTAFFDTRWKITKIKLQLFGEMGRSIEEFYLDSIGQLYFLKLQSITYNRPVYAENAGPFTEKNTGSFAVAFTNDKVSSYEKFRGKRKFEKKPLSEEKKYWQARCEQFRIEMNSHSKERMQERYRQLLFDATGMHAVASIQYAGQQYSFVKQPVRKNGAVEILLVKLQLQPSTGEWKKTGERFLFNEPAQFLLQDDYCIRQYKDQLALYISYTIGGEQKLYTNWISLTNLSIL